jgi:myosin-1
VETAAKLFMVPAKTLRVSELKLSPFRLSLLQDSLCFRSISTGWGRRGSLITIPLDEPQAIFTRDALAKGVYEKTFSWLVQHINAKLNSKVRILLRIQYKQNKMQTQTPKLTLGILDIYGFEVFENNSFEQFCINFCNEKLQQLFIELTLESEQKEYIKEGIQWEPVSYFNNKIICDLVEGV